MRRTSLAAVAALVASLLVGVVSTSAAAPFESGTALPPGPAGMTPVKLALVGDEVWATWSGSDGVRHLYRTADDGTGSWQPVDDPETGLPVTGGGFWDGVLYSFTPDAGQAGCSVLRVASAAGVWTTPSGACPTSVAVGPGGDLVRVRTVTGATVNDAANGSVVASGAAGESAIFQRWLWSVQSGALLGHDTTGSAPDRQVAVPSDCQGSMPKKVTGDAAGGEWALAVCTQGERVVPLTGSGVSLMLPHGYPTPFMANGFVYGQALVDHGAGLEVRDLSAQLVGHDYGPGHAFVESDEGAPRIAWVENGTTTVRVAHLDWLGAAPSAGDDTTPPTIDSTSGSPAVIAVVGFDQDLTFSWTASDNLAGALAYDVQVGGLGGDPAFKPYQSTYDTTSVLKGIVGSGTVCFRVRATDRLGNPSAWSAPRCTLLDHDRPQMLDEISDRWSFPHILNRISRVTVTDRFHAGDDTGVASYDVQQRVAPPDKGFGPWQSPTAWQAITTTSVTRTVVPGAEVCFRSRARDLAGRTSPWGDRHCYVVPQDDDVLTRHGPAPRLAVRGAFGGRLTRLRTTVDAALSHSYVGRSIVVRELIHDHAIGCLRVTWAGRPVKGCGSADGGKRFAWVWATSHLTRQGQVFVNSDPYQLNDVDAVAVLR